jgi:hypothetical protein
MTSPLRNYELQHRSVAGHQHADVSLAIRITAEDEAVTGHNVIDSSNAEAIRRFNTVAHRIDAIKEVRPSMPVRDCKNGAGRTRWR